MKPGGSSSEQEPHILPAMVQALFFCAIREGLEPMRLLERAGIALDAFDMLDAPLPYSRVLAIIQEIERTKPHIHLGLSMGMAFGTKRMNILGCALSHAPRVGTALEDFMRFQHAIHGGLFAWTLSARQNNHVVQLAAPHSWLSDFNDVAWPSEAPIAMIMNLVRQLCDQPVLPREVSFRHRARASTDNHDTYFGIPVRFEAELNEIVFPREVFDMPIPKANAALYGHLIQHLELSLGTISPQQTSRIVRQYFIHHLDQGKPTKSSVARAHGMSPRTLLRRLHDEGTSFELLLTEVRRDMALVYVADDSIPLTEVASRLGYSEPSPFYRAFSRWFGSTPLTHRTHVRQQLQTVR